MNLLQRIAIGAGIIGALVFGNSKADDESSLASLRSATLNSQTERSSATLNSQTERSSATSPQHVFAYAPNSALVEEGTAREILGVDYFVKNASRDGQRLKLTDDQGLEHTIYEDGTDVALRTQDSEAEMEVNGIRYSCDGENVNDDYGNVINVGEFARDHGIKNVGLVSAMDMLGDEVVVAERADGKSRVMHASPQEIGVEELPSGLEIDAMYNDGRKFHIIGRKSGEEKLAGDFNYGKCITIVNRASETDCSVANYFATKRGVYKILKLNVPGTEEIDRDQFNQLTGQLRRKLDKYGLNDPVYTFVLTRGIPLKIFPTNAENPGFETDFSNSFNYDWASVDSEWALLGSGREDIIGLSSIALNPRYEDFLSEFGVESSNIRTHLVMRLLDKNAVDLATRASRNLETNLENGKWIVHDNLFETSLIENGGRDYCAGFVDSLTNVNPSNIIYSTNYLPPENQANVIFNFSWGTHDSYSYDNRIRFRPQGYLPGGVYLSGESVNCATLVPPPKNWQVLGSYYPLGQLYPTNQGQVVDALSLKLNTTPASGAIGNVYEPFVFGLPNLKIFCRNYSGGNCFAESAWKSLRVVSGNSVVIGDPGMVVFQRENN